MPPWQKCIARRQRRSRTGGGGGWGWRSPDVPPPQASHAWEKVVTYMVFALALACTMREVRQTRLIPIESIATSVQRPPRYFTKVWWYSSEAAKVRAKRAAETPFPF